ncbi:MAG TPA: hypothetical protein VFQ76_16840, partial [Longimicrobiaceae bacterium]|nr:hypothetical protein [Longimicrobiaceae bacterium]
VTRTGDQGRSGNVWILGPRAGEHAAEVRAVLPEGTVVVDTVRATAAAAAPAVVEVVGDTVRTLAVGDTVRPALRVRDRFGNEVPASQAPVTWRSLAPAVVSVDSAGRARALELGDAVLEAKAGTAAARLRVAVSAVVDVFPVDAGALLSPRVVAIQRGGGRLVAVGEAQVYDGQTHRGVPLGYAFAGSAWTSQSIAPGTLDLRVTSLHVAPAGRAFAATQGGVYSSLPGPGWAPHARLRDALHLAGSGDVLFVGVRRPTAVGWTDSLAVYRYAGDELTDLRLPPEYGLPWYAASLAAASADELYLTGYTTTSYWNGSGWSAVREAGATADLALYQLAAHPQGGAVWGIDYGWPRRLFRLRAGVAERVPFPLERKADEYGTRIAVDGDGNPFLSFSGGVLALDARGWRTLPIPGEWTATGALWPEPDGTVWVAATRPIVRSPAGGAAVQLAILRIRPRAASSTSTDYVR